MKSANKFLTLVIHTFFNLCITKSLCNKLWSYSIDLYQFLLLKKKKKKCFALKSFQKVAQGLAKLLMIIPERFIIFHAITLHHQFSSSCTVLVEHPVVFSPSFTVLLHSGH